jgi:BirA family biotin operon repressor/biotin-[acetyl-CoA-carboxylase] ligase
MTAPVRWPSEAIWEAVEPTLPGFAVEVLPRIDSTNSELMRRLRGDRQEPILLVTEQQTAGRGRLGRQWHSGEDQAVLTFSLGLALAPQDWSGLSLAVGLSIAQSLHPDIGLKWPNDLWWQGRKLAGILIETASFGELRSKRYVVVGVGINIHAPDVDGLSTPAVGLAELLPDMDAPQALARVVAPLVRAIQAFERQGFAPFQSDFNARDALSHIAVTLSSGVEGVALGVDRVGALLVETEDGLVSVTSSEVSVRPARGLAAKILDRAD